MSSKKITTRENKSTPELKESIVKKYKGLQLRYEEVYYLDFAVDEDTGNIDKSKKVKFYTKNQMDSNLKALKNAYLIAKGAAAPSEIKRFRKKYKIPASIFSIVLGFSKNTISNIEKDGNASLSSGRLIKMCLNDKNIIYKYLQLCDSIDALKKEELSERLLKE